MKPSKVFTILAMGMAGTLVLAQSSLQVITAELSVPFGSVEGKLFAVDEHLVFVDDQRPESSFSLTRENVENLSVRGNQLLVSLKSPVRDRSGSRSQLTFRLSGSADRNWLSSWANAARESRPAAPAMDVRSYQVRHKHFRPGSCTGQLLFSRSGVSYESVSDLEHSRQWDYKDIKEVKHSNPYELEIDPFDGGNYDFEFLGTGMDTNDYRVLVDRIAQARAAR